MEFSRQLSELQLPNPWKFLGKVIALLARRLLIVLVVAEVLFLVL